MRKKYVFSYQLDGFLEVDLDLDNFVSPEAAARELIESERFTDQQLLDGIYDNKCSSAYVDLDQIHPLAFNDDETCEEIKLNVDVFNSKQNQ